MIVQLYLTWIFLGIMAYFFYKRFQETRYIVLIPVYFLILVTLGIPFLAGAVIILYLLFFI